MCDSTTVTIILLQMKWKQTPGRSGYMQEIAILSSYTSKRSKEVQVHCISCYNLFQSISWRFYPHSLKNFFVTCSFSYCHVYYYSCQKMTCLNFGVYLCHEGMEGTYYACHMMLLWPEYVGEGLVGHNLSIHCAIFTDEFNKISEKRSQVRHKLNLLNCTEVWSRKQAATY